jgi:hypothetical protein
MRPFGSLNPTDLIPVPPDTVGVAEISSAGAVVAQGWPTNAHIVAFGSTQNFWADMGSTGVAIRAASSAGSTAIPSEILRDGTTAEAAGTITLSFWAKSI